MKATLLYGSGRRARRERDDPKILKPTDAILRLSRAASAAPTSGHTAARSPRPAGPMGHDTSASSKGRGAVKNVKNGQFVVGSFATSDNSCPHCRHGYQSSCVNREFMTGAQAPLLRVSNADGTLVATKEIPSPVRVALGLDEAGAAVIERDAGGREPRAEPLVQVSWMSQTAMRPESTAHR